MNRTISPELDAKLAEMIRNSSKKAEEINVEVKKTIAKTNAAVDAASKVTIDTTNIAKASTECKRVALEANQRVKALDEALNAAANIRFEFKAVQREVR